MIQEVGLERDGSATARGYRRNDRRGLVTARGEVDTYVRALFRQ